ncbi:MAG: hypothetical protein AAB885_03485 [Patescibacteria group bacterium]
MKKNTVIVFTTSDGYKQIEETLQSLVGNNPNLKITFAQLSSEDALQLLLKIVDESFKRNKRRDN